VKKVIAILFCFFLLISIEGCAVQKSAPVNGEQPTSKVEKNVDTAAAEKAALLEKKAQQGYDLFFQKKYKEAVAVEDEVIKEDPSFYKAYYIKGITLCYNNNFKEGSANIDKALTLKPNDYGARFNKALSLELYHHYDDAIVWYNKSLEIEKGEWSYYGIASIYGRRGDVENTVKYLEVAIAINPDIKKEASKEADFNPVKNNKKFINIIK